MEAALSERLLEAGDHREFIAAFFESTRGSKSGRMSYARFGRKAGVSSRAQIREIALGQRPLTATMSAKFAEAMGLKGYWRDYFTYLAARSNPQVLPHAASASEVERKLVRLRQLIRARSGRIEIAADVASADRLFGAQSVSQVYAALGSVERGASVDEIRARTRLNTATLARCLQNLVEHGLARKLSADRYAARSLHVALTGVGASKAFQGMFFNALTAAQKEAERDFSSPEHLFFSSSFCVRQSDLKRLKLELRETLLRFVDRAEDSAGDLIVNLVTGFVGPA